MNLQVTELLWEITTMADWLTGNKQDNHDEDLIGTHVIATSSYVILHRRGVISQHQRLIVGCRCVITLLVASFQAIFVKISIYYTQ